MLWNRDTWNFWVKYTLWRLFVYQFLNKYLNFENFIDSFTLRTVVAEYSYKFEQKVPLQSILQPKPFNSFKFYELFEVHYPQTLNNQSPALREIIAALEARKVG